ncbi:MAG: TIGR02281 family clan AA aspartic protease [Methylobacillus sp.]|jgi:aspartyl protease family protein|nr:TIGR02281 family clan AA aspartic protease [Methylobacillus sp.]
MRLLILFASLLLPCAAFAETHVNVVGLFSGKAILAINGGQPKTWAVGQTTPEGVRIISASSEKVVLEADGKRRELGMGQGIAIGGDRAEKNSGAQTATLFGNNAGHFIGDGFINGTSVKFLVDTGATAVAMGKAQADRLGLVYMTPEREVSVSTASGITKAWRVSLNTVKIGDIELHQVEALVVAGDPSSIVLLGMTVLNRLQMERNGQVMTLTKKY